MATARLARRRWLILLLFLAFLAAASAAVIYAWLLADLPALDHVDARMVRPTSRLLDRHGRLLYEVIDPDMGKQINLDLAALPPSCVQATLATEDSRFYLHPGVDPVAILRAAWQNYRAGGGIVSGGSTLTQQLARNLLLDPNERYEQTLRRKLREAWLAWRLERRYTKDQILALYLNQTYYGNFAFGLEAAAQVFFAKPASQLSRGECTLLAGLVQYPSGYNPLHDPAMAKLRQQTVLRLMREAGYITAAEAAAIDREPLYYRSRLFEIDAPHFVMYVQSLLEQRLGVARLRAGGLTVVTTLDLDLQQRAERAVRYRLDQINCRLPGACDANTDPNRRVDNAAAVVLDAQNGDLLAMVGSPDYFDARIQGNVNAALALRQPGSAIKPLTYAAALDHDWGARVGYASLTPASIIADLPATFYVEDKQGSRVPYEPVNYDQLYHGPVSVRAALANSYNIPAVKVLDHIGVETLQQIAAQAGITTFTREYGLALTLGGGEVKLLELATAYGMFLDGRRLETRAILSVDSPGDCCAAAAISGGRRNPVIAPETAYLITDILSDQVARLPAFGGGSVLELPFPAAVKTGTTTDWRDNWTLGYTPQRIVGVWVGNADNAPMLGVSGIDGAGPIWRDLMIAAHREPPSPFPRPDGIVEETVCSTSGLLPSPDCPRTRRERFVAGDQPTATDRQWVRIAVDAATGQRADEQTPPARTVERTYWLLPPEYHDWMIGQGIALAPPVRAEVATPNAETPPVAALPSPNGAAPPPAVTGPLMLTDPTSNVAYQIHPGVPASRQRIQVAGRTNDGASWAVLRLVKDGVALAEARDAARLQVWWQFELGEHRFWLEGQRTDGAPVERTEPAYIVVEPFQMQEVSSGEIRP